MIRRASYKLVGNFLDTDGPCAAQLLGSLDRWTPLTWTGRIMRHLRALLVRALLFGCALAQWPCSVCESPITDETAVAQTRWDAANCDDAWNAVVFAWENYSADPGTEALSFVAFVSNFFGGPADLQCTNVIEDSCSVGISCQATRYPAGLVTTSN